MKIKINLSLALCAVSGIAMSAFTIMCYMKYVNPDSLLVTPSPTVTVHEILCAVLVVLALCIPYVFMRKVDVTGQAPNTSFVIFSSSLLGFMFCGYIFHNVYNIILNGGASAVISINGEASFNGLLAILHVTGIILSIPCAVYFIMIALKKNLGESASLCILATAPVLFCAVKLIYAFMETSAKVNSAGRKINIVALCLCVFFFLYEANIFSPKKRDDISPKTLRKYSQRYLASGFAAIISLFIARVSTLLLRAFWLLESGESYVMDAIWVTMILYIMARLTALPNESKE